MKDAYLNFANSNFGRKVTTVLGLPQPLVLERYNPNAPVVKESVLVGGNLDSGIVNTLLSQLDTLPVTTLAHTSIATEPSLRPPWSTNVIKAAIFDATGLNDSTESSRVYEFFHECVRSLSVSGRIIIIGRPPRACASVRKATVQRSLEGLSRSLAKELRKAITVQLVYVEEHAEAQLESTLRFLLSPRSSYVSGQVITVTNATGMNDSSFDWTQPLKGKKALVTGASQGIGAAIAEVLVRDGADIICLDVPQAEAALNLTSSRLNGKSITLDLTSPEASRTLVEAALRDDGWDIIVHNAGITRDKTIANMRPDLWNSVVNVNLSSQERINEALLAANALNTNGRIVCVSSISGIAGNRGQSNYALSKAGVIGMVESSAPMLKRHNITINAVAPGFIETKMTATIPFAIREVGRRINSMSQGGQAIDVAETIAWLASPASRGLTANTIRVCGQSLLGA